MSSPISREPNPEVVKLLEKHGHESAIGAPVRHELTYGCRRLPRAAWHGRERARLEDLGRAAIARALIFESDILLMDEPFSRSAASTRSRCANSRRVDPNLAGNRENDSLRHVNSIGESVLLSQQILIVSQRPATVFKRVEGDLPYPRQYGDVRLLEIETKLMQDFRTKL